MVDPQYLHEHYAVPYLQTKIMWGLINSITKPIYIYMWYEIERITPLATQNPIGVDCGIAANTQ